MRSGLAHCIRSKPACERGKGRAAGGCAGLWPSVSGWHLLRATGADNAEQVSAFYVQPADRLPGIRAARDRDGAVAAIGDAWVDAIQIMGDADHVRARVDDYATAGVDLPIVFALPWGEDRAATVRTTLEALAPR